MIYELVIGRFQPFHKGHEAIVRTLLDEGRNVCIAIRNTERAENNPYSADERVQMIEGYFKNEPRVKIIVIPDIANVIYGRKVGWGVREIRLSEEIENISATKIRERQTK